MEIPRSHRMYITLVAILAIVLLLAACGGGETAEPEAPAAAATPTTAPTDTPEPTATPEPADTPTPEVVEEESPLPTQESRGIEESSPMATPESRGEEPMPGDDALAQLIERAKAQLSDEVSGVAVEDIEVASTEQVDWPDASLGCPEPGMMYAQVITPGYRIMLEAGGETYEYHTTLDPEGQIVQCEES